MQNVPKIVSERLKAGAPAVDRPLGDPVGHPVGADAHPDADLLTAFAERALPEFERTAVLDHLSRCGDCRDVVALALPASEEMSTEVAAGVRTSVRGWLRWPALRWGLVAAGIIAFASFGILRERHQSTMAVNKAARVEVAVNEPKKQELDRFVSPAPEPKEKLRLPAAPAFTDALTASNSVVDAKKSAPRPEASRVLSPQVKSGNSGGAFAANTLPHGPRLANQSQLQNNAQNQAPMAPPPSAYSNQAAAGGVSANTGAPAASETVEVASAAPAISTEARGLDGAQGRDQSRDQSMVRAKAPVAAAASAAPFPSTPSTSGAGAAINQPYQAGSFGGPITKAAPGQMVGYVFDPSGAAMPNVRITVTPSNAKGAKTAVTDSQGAWLIAGLPTGNYKAQAEASGFKTTVLDLNYDANQPSLYRFNLDVGSVAETVEVTGGNAQVQTESANIGGSVNGRDLTQLTTLTPARMPRWTIGATGGLQRSLDQGKTWQAVDVNANPASFAYADSSATNLQITAETSSSKVSKDKNSGKLARQKISAPIFRAVTAAGSDVWAGGTGGALYHSADAGNNWTRIVPAHGGATLTGDVLSIDFPDPQHCRVSTSTSEVWATADGGLSWQK
jgi:hypothetical protein